MELHFFISRAHYASIWSWSSLCTICKIQSSATNVVFIETLFFSLSLTHSIDMSIKALDRKKCYYIIKFIFFSIINSQQLSMHARESSEGADFLGMILTHSMSVCETHQLCKWSVEKSIVHISIVHASPIHYSRWMMIICMSSLLHFYALANAFTAHHS